MAPFYADRLYLDLTQGREAESVHLALFPEYDDSAVDEALEERNAMAQTLTSMVLSLRRKVNIKVRQPLAQMMVPVVDDRQRRAIESVRELVLNEVNVKALNIVESDNAILVKRVKLDFKKLGPKFGKQMKAVAAAIAALSQADINVLERNGSLDVTLADGATASIDATDVEIFSEDIPGWLVANEGNLTVALDVTVTPELRSEGIARDIINRIQNIRKERDYAITDRIKLAFDSGNAEIAPVLDKFGAYIANQVLASDICAADIAAAAAADVATLDIDGLEVRVAITK